VLARPDVRSAAAANGKQVALVGPASASKAEAEAMLERMRGMLGQTVREPAALQAQVFQTHEGWRAAIWPFASREEAQLINATLIARGLKTKAVDF
jgi:SPOR domain